MVSTWLPGAPLAVDGPAPAMPGPVVIRATSCCTPAPCGISRPTALASAVKSPLRTLTTIALPAGAPSARATLSDTTALTPPMPIVPNATTRSFLVVRPAATTVPPSGSLSSLPIMYETAIPPPATPSHRAFEAPVGRAANERKTDGSTPSTAVYAPLIRIRTASIRSVAVTPGSRDTAASSLRDSENGATMSRSAWYDRRSGATEGRAAVRANGTGEPDIRRAPDWVSPGSTGVSPVDGRTCGKLNREVANDEDPRAGLAAPDGPSEPRGAALSTVTSTPASRPSAARAATTAGSIRRGRARPIARARRR